MRLEAVYTPRHEELIAAERAAISYGFPSIRNFNNLSNFAIYFVVALASVATGPTIFEELRPSFGTTRSVGILVAITVALMLLALVVSQRLSAAWTIHAINRKKRSATVKVELSEKGVRWTSADNGAWIDWTGIDRALLLPTLLLMISGGLTYVVPTRAFSSDDEMKAFVEGVWIHLTAEARTSSHIHPSLRTRLGQG